MITLYLEHRQELENVEETSLEWLPKNAKVYKIVGKSSKFVPQLIIKKDKEFVSFKTFNTVENGSKRSFDIHLPANMVFTDQHKIVFPFKVDYIRLYFFYTTDILIPPLKP